MDQEDGIEVDLPFQWKDLEALVGMRNDAVKQLTAAVRDLEKLFSGVPASADHAVQRAWMHFETSSAVVRNIDWGIRARSACEAGSAAGLSGQPPDQDRREVTDRETPS